MYIDGNHSHELRRPRYRDASMGRGGVVNKNLIWIEGGEKKSLFFYFTCEKKKKKKKKKRRGEEGSERVM